MAKSKKQAGVKLPKEAAPKKAGSKTAAAPVPAASTAAAELQRQATPFGAPAEVGDLKDAPKQDQELAKLTGAEVKSSKKNQ